VSGVILTSAEREKFALYLERDAADSEALISKLEQTPGGGILATLMRAEADASRIVAKKLRLQERK